MGEQIFKRSEVRARLNITTYRYKQLVDSGILAAPIRLTANSHPFHTESQLRVAEEKLRKQSIPTPIKKTTISRKLFLEIRESSLRAKS